MEDKKIPVKVEKWLDDLYKTLFEPKPKGGKRKMRRPRKDDDGEGNKGTTEREYSDKNYKDEKD